MGMLIFRGQSYDVLSHIKKLGTLEEQLDAVVALVSEDVFVITLPGNLSETYQFLIITELESRSDALTWELVTNQLLHEDMKRYEQCGDGVTAFKTFNASDKKRSGRLNKKADVWNHCSKMCHEVGECSPRFHDIADRQRPQRANVV
uniref:Uncharacterized protein n=1 Tax=Peronospora matthiolae TaxID=2874970 RepID=A0AAV1V1C4_9STRA